MFFELPEGLGELGRGALDGGGVLRVFGGEAFVLGLHAIEQGLRIEDEREGIDLAARLGVGAEGEEEVLGLEDGDDGLRGGDEIAGPAGCVAPVLIVGWVFLGVMDRQASGAGLK